MARPIKHNADYFPHDADMRNDPRIKALRRKYGIEGYGIYCMLLELLTDSDFFEYKSDSLNIEIMAGDFDIDPDRLNEVLRYICQIDLIQLENDKISCKSLNNRLDPLLSKRKRDRPVVIDTDNTQSKVKERKVKESKVDESDKTLEWFLNQFDEMFVENLKMTHKGKDFMQAAKEAYAHLAADPIRLHSAEASDCKRLLNTWLSNQKINKNGKQPTARTNEEISNLVNGYMAAKKAGSI